MGSTVTAVAIGDDSVRLVELEGVIERGLTTFVEVGAALMEIRDSRLYRETHGTFEAYCRERWGWDRTYAHRTIQAAEVSRMLPMGNILPSERVARRRFEQRAFLIRRDGAKYSLATFMREWRAPEVLALEASIVDAARRIAVWLETGELVRGRAAA